MRIALAHDWLVGLRGGERVLDAIARALAPDHQLSLLYTIFDDRRPLTPALDAIPRRVSILGRLPAANRLRRWLLPLYPVAVASLSRRLAADHARRPIDLLISTSSAAIKALRPPPGVPHLCYCHTPPRYLWSQSDQYAGGLRGLGLRAFSPPLRQWDRATTDRVTTFLANSTHTRTEIRRCYDRDSTVLFPPVRTDFFTPSDQPWNPSPPEWLRAAGLHADTPFWLAAGALEPYKRFDLAIDAARNAGAPLVIAGDGSDLPRLRRHAGPTVTFLGRITDDQLRDLFRTARLLVFPQVEDFGIIAAEAQACGCPVLARAAGGALDTVLDAVSGALVQSIADPGAAGRVPERTSTTTAACRSSAERFSQAAFAQGLRRAVASVLYDRPDARADPA